MSTQAKVSVPDAVLRALDALSDDAAVHIYPDDLERCSRSECVVSVYSVRVTNMETGEHSVPLFSREQVAIALAAAPEVAVPAVGEHYEEVKATLQGVHAFMESISAVERRVGPLGSHARGYTHKITNALSHLDALAAPQSAKPKTGEAS
jgi:hypothetical protein